MNGLKPLTILAENLFRRRLAGFWIGLCIKLKGNIGMQSFINQLKNIFFYQLQVYGMLRETPFYRKNLRRYFKGILKAHVFNTCDGTLSL